MLGQLFAITPINALVIGGQHGVDCSFLNGLLRIFGEAGFNECSGSGQCDERTVGHCRQGQDVIKREFPVAADAHADSYSDWKCDAEVRKPALYPGSPI
jgi:hypothetical protein